MTQKPSTLQPPSSADKADRHLGTEHLRADLKAHTARSGAVTLVSQAIKFVVSIITAAVLGRLLTPEDYGLVGMVVVFTGFIALFQGMGLSSATLQREKISQAQVSTLFWINVATGTVAMLLTASAAPAITRFYGDRRLTWIVLALSVGFFFGGWAPQHEALLKRQMRFAALAAVEITSLALGVATAFVMAWNGAGYWALVANQLVMSLAYTIGVWIASGWRPAPPVRHSDIRPMLVFGYNITGFSLLSHLAHRLDSLLIGQYWGPRPLSFYAKAWEIALLPATQASAPLNSVAVAALSPLANSPDRYRRVYLRILEKVAMISMPGMALMIAMSDWIVRFLLGPQWNETARILAILGLVGLLEPVGNTGGWLLLSQGRGHHILQWGIIDCLATVISVVAGLPWGAIGVATSYTVAEWCVRSPLKFWFVCRTGPVRVADIYRTIAPSAVSALAVLTVLLALRRWVTVPGPFAGLVGGTVIAVAVTFLFLSLQPTGRTALRDLFSVMPVLFRLGKVAQ